MATPADAARPADHAPAPPGDDAFARELRGFGAVGLLAMLAVIGGNFVFPPLSAVLALVWARRALVPWRDLGYVRPRSWLATIVWGVALGGALKLLLKTVVMPLLGAPPINPAFQELVGNTALAVPFAFRLIVVAGWGEEAFFRGYLFERLGALWGRGAPAKLATILATTAFFAALHALEQGVPGVQQAAITGLVFGGVYAATGRIWPLVVAHAAFDLTALVIIWGGWERALATLFF
jgi:uncharacterized protein